MIFPITAMPVRRPPMTRTLVLKSSVHGRTRLTFTAAPTETKKIGVNTSATGSIRSTTRSN